MPSVKESGNFITIKDGSSTYTLDKRNGAITEKSTPQLTKADIKIVSTAISRRYPDLPAVIRKRYFHLLS